MLGSIQKFFDTHIRSKTESSDENDAMHGLHVATAALLIEVMRADYEASQAEQSTITQTMKGFFDLEADEVEQIVGLAEEEANKASCLYEFASLVDKNFSQDQKKQIVKMLWQVAYADADKDKYEEHLIRKISDLLHVSHSDFIRARLVVEEGMC